MKLRFNNLCGAVVLAGSLVIPSSLVADHHETKVDPTGTWTWTRQGRDGNEVTSTLKLKANGQQLTGKMSGRGGDESDISNGKIEGDKITFSVARSFGGNDFTINYTGKVVGDSLTVSSKFTGRDGEERTREFTAKRSVALSGDWKSTYERSDGSSMDITLTLKQDGQRVTGMVKVNEFEIPLEGSFKEGDLNYTTKWEANGNTMTSKFVGKVAGSKITGKVTSNFGDQERVRDVEYTRAQ